MRVWVTRTEPGASRLGAALAARGFDVLQAPVLDIERHLAPLPDGEFDCALYVSEHAVAGASASIAAARGRAASGESRRALLPPFPSAAIGEAAHTALRRLGVTPAWPPFEHARDVVLKLPPPRRALVVKGEGGGDSVQRWLRRQGGAAVEWNVYRRAPAETEVDGDIDAIVLGSGDGLREAARLWFAEARAPQVPVLAPSQRVAALAAEAGFSDVLVTAGAHQGVVASTLQSLRAEARNEASRASRTQSTGRQHV